MIEALARGGFLEESLEIFRRAGLEEDVADHERLLLARYAGILTRALAAEGATAESAAATRALVARLERLIEGDAKARERFALFPLVIAGIALLTSR